MLVQLLIGAIVVFAIAIILYAILGTQSSEKQVMAPEPKMGTYNEPQLKRAMNFTFGPLSCRQGKSYMANYPQLPQPTKEFSPRTARFLFQLIMNIAASNCDYLGPIPFPRGWQAHKLRGRTPLGFSMHRKRNFGYFLVSPINCRGERTVIIAYSGTLYWDEWIADALIPQVAPSDLNNYESGARVHAGFYGIYQAIRGQLWTNWEGLLGRTRLIICGHSMGAALATLTAYDFAQEKPEVYAFAPPRVGNNAFAEQSNRLLPLAHKIINTADVIPTLPPPVFPRTTYTHTGRIVVFTNNKGSIGDNHVEAYKEYVGLA